MKFEQRDETLRAAQAAARRLLVRAIDLRFDLDDTADQAQSNEPVNRTNLLQLRADTDAVRLEIDRLAELIWPPLEDHTSEPEDMEEAKPVAHV